jgi:hypothetical protein
MLQATANYLKGQTGLEKIVFCLYGHDSYDVFEKQLKKDFPNESSDPE